MTFGTINDEEVLIQLLVDDGSNSRGHRANILNPEFNFMGSFSGPHKDFGKMTVINYAAGFVGEGENDVIEEQMEAFLNEEVQFPEMPDGFISWKQHSKISVKGALATKVTTRTCKMKDGSEKKIDVTNEKTFKLV